MSRSFDEKLEELHKSKLLKIRTNIWPEGTPEFNHKLCIAEDLLQVSWCMSASNSYHNLVAANIKVPLITNLRKSMEELFTHSNNFKRENRENFLSNHANYSCSVMEKFIEAELSFKFVEKSGGYQLLADCLCPFKIDSLGEGTSETNYHKLIQVPALYGFKMKENISIKNLTRGSRWPLEKEVATLLDGTVKPDNILGLDLHNESVSFSRLKFGQEDKVDVVKSHPDFLKIVALIRMFHSKLLQNIKPSYTHADRLEEVVTYGLLTERKYVRVIGIKAIVPKTSCTKKRYKYLLFNVGVFPLAPSNEEEKQQLDLLISFLLEASRQTIFEEKELISNITKESIGKPKMTSSVIGTSTFLQGDKLVINRRMKLGASLDTKTTTITLDEYQFEMSTFEGKYTAAKDIFWGSIEHSKQPVFVKIFNNSRPFNSIGNIFLANSEVLLNNRKCSEYIEISLAGKELHTMLSIPPEEKMHIITQLLLELDHIHSKKIIHNDVKPSNIIRLEQKQLLPVDTKEELPNQKEASPKCFFKLIDFELAKQFNTEDGDTCYYQNDIVLESTAGTSSYNAPEKEGTENYIHPKTDIYSLGLIFVELITENDIDKYQLSSFEPDTWKIIEIKCNEFEKGQKIYTMLRSMLSNIRKERMTARECLQLLEINEQVDTQDYTHYFFPTNTSTSNTVAIEAKDEEKSSISNKFLSKQKVIKKSTSHKNCCKCTNGNCQNCACGSQGNACTSCGSVNCTNKEENYKRKRTSKSDETDSEDESNSKKIKSK